jgi:hypothetical protein
MGQHRFTSGYWFFKNLLLFAIGLSVFFGFALLYATTDGFYGYDKYVFHPTPLFPLDNKDQAMKFSVGGLCWSLPMVGLAYVGLYLIEIINRIIVFQELIEGHIEVVRSK